MQIKQLIAQRIYSRNKVSYVTFSRLKNVKKYFEVGEENNEFITDKALLVFRFICLEYI